MSSRIIIANLLRQMRNIIINWFQKKNAVIRRKRIT